MTNSVSKVSYNYTAKGNEYKKSNTGKKVGTAVGAAVGSGLLYSSLSMADISRDLRHMCRVEGKTQEEAIKTFFSGSTAKTFKEFVSPQRALKQLKRSADLYNTYTKSKIANCATMIGHMSFFPLAVAGLGFIAGYCVDKIVDHFTMKKADKAAEAQQK